MKWTTRAGMHVDRTACAWLMLRFIDPGAEFVFIEPRQRTAAGSDSVRSGGRDGLRWALRAPSDRVDDRGRAMSTDTAGWPS